MVCVALASGAFALVTYVCRELEADSRAERASATEALARQLRESRAKLARLPRLRETAQARSEATSAAAPPAAGAGYVLADLAARTGVMLRSLEPASKGGAPGAARGPVGRTLRIDALTDFAGLDAFLSGLAALPMLVVPHAVSVKREASALAFGATLEVFDTLPSSGSEPDVSPGEGSRLRADPFGLRHAGSPGRAIGRLLGFVADGRRALALFEAAGASGAQAITAAPGQALGEERIVHVDALGVTLAGRDGIRRIALPEDGR